MILKLRKRSIEVISMKVPEPTEYFNISIDYEHGTQHLVPVIYINDVKVKEGINKLKPSKNKRVEIKVNMLDHRNQIIKSYRGTFQYYNYSVFGKPPVDLEYFKYVEALEARIKELEEFGEVI